MCVLIWKMKSITWWFPFLLECVSVNVRVKRVYETICWILSKGYFCFLFPLVTTSKYSLAPTWQRQNVTIIYSTDAYSATAVCWVLYNEAQALSPLCLCVLDCSSGSTPRITPTFHSILLRTVVAILFSRSAQCYFMDTVERWWNRNYFFFFPQ